MEDDLYKEPSPQEIIEAMSCKEMHDCLLALVTASFEHNAARREKVLRDWGFYLEQD